MCYNPNITSKPMINLDERYHDYLGGKKKFRIDNSRTIKHTALIDCELLSKVYINLIDQKEPTLDFKNKEEEVSKLNTEKVIYSTKVIKPSPEELKNHQIYLKTSLKKNFY